MTKTFKEISEAIKKAKGAGNQIVFHGTGDAPQPENKPVKEELEQVDEKLNPSMGAGEYIKDFQASTDTQFAGKSKEKRRTMALAAYLQAKRKVSEEVEHIEEATATVKTDKYSWGTMKTVHHGKDFSVPLHPEHHKAIHALKDQQEHKFKDETGRHWTAKRDGEHVHLHSANDGPKTKIKHSDLKEEVESIEEGFVVHYHDEKGQHKNTSKVFTDKAKADAHAARGNSIDKVGGKYSVHKIDSEGRSVKESHAPVAPTIDRKYIKGTPEWKAHKEKNKPINGHPTNNVKEDAAFDEEGNLMAEKKSYGDFMAQLLEYEVDKNGRYVHKGNYGSAYKDPEGADDADDKPKKAAGRKVGSKVGPKKNLGNSKLHTK